MPASQLTYSPADIAQRLGVGERTVAAWIARGELRAINVSRSPHSRKPRLRITAAALEAFEASRQTVPVSERAPRRRSKPTDVIEFYR